MTNTCDSGIAITHKCRYNDAGIVIMVGATEDVGNNRTVITKDSIALTGDKA